MEILKEFQPFQDYFEQADRKKNQLKGDVTQFLKTLKVAMVKMQNGGAGAAHWTLGQEQQESTEALSVENVFLQIQSLSEIVQQKIDEIQYDSVSKEDNGEVIRFEVQGESSVTKEARIQEPKHNFQNSQARSKSCNSTDA